MSEKKTCVLVTAFTENQPGFLDFSYRIRALATHYQLTVVSSFPIKQIELLVAGVDYVVIDGGKGRIGWLVYLWRCANLIKSQPPNVVMLLHSMASPIVLMVGNIPTITYWNEHPTHVAPAPEGVSPIKTLSRRLVRLLMFHSARRASLVMPIGEAHRDDLLAHGCAVNQVKMIYMGVDQSFYRVALTDTFRERSRQLRLVYIGSVQKDRGRDVMLEAMLYANMNGKIAHLTIVGANDEQLKICSEIVLRLGVGDSVTVQGRVSGQEVPMYLKDADAGLCLWENLPWYQFNPPTKLFEYLVAGLPALASNIETHTQYVRDGFNGIIFEYDSKSLAEAIQRLWHLLDELPAIKQRTSDASSAYLWNKIEPEFLAAVERVAFR